MYPLVLRMFSYSSSRGMLIALTLRIRISVANEKERLPLVCFKRRMEKSIAF